MIPFIIGGLSFVILERQNNSSPGLLLSWGPWARVNIIINYRILDDKYFYLGIIPFPVILSLQGEQYVTPLFIWKLANGTYPCLPFHTLCI